MTAEIVLGAHSVRAGDSRLYTGVTCVVWISDGLARLRGS